MAQYELKTCQGDGVYVIWLKPCSVSTIQQVKIKKLTIKDEVGGLDDDRNRDKVERVALKYQISNLPNISNEWRSHFDQFKNNADLVKLAQPYDRMGIKNCRWSKMVLQRISKQKDIQFKNFKSLLEITKLTLKTKNTFNQSSLPKPSAEEMQSEGDQRKPIQCRVKDQ
ncbi:hypothetical protein OXYTRIMIC_510 [Oxytricha trifallax]|uniref:Uncharacterized protein n=1 Tax=Oxytricha trifallax TaxID=1172189 RepID=A0A073I017_9SPIT|nr:hypothetical protein OXYTRIMIC_510 [Oxytricha trifallax]